MVRNVIEKLALPGFAAAIFAGVALASTAEIAGPAYGDELPKLEAAQAGASAKALFARADINRDGALDVNEFGALSIVTAELARLNGFIAFDIAEDARTVSLDIEAPLALPQSERARIGAVAAREFYLAAGDDAALSENEFIAFELERFSDADKNRNGVLDAYELKTFAARTARLISTSA